MPVNVKNNKQKRESAIICFFIGIFVHMFGLVNTIHNNDNIAVVNGYGTGISSGRWMLTFIGNIAKKLSFSYNLPWLNGIVTILFLSIAFYFLIKIFNITQRINIVFLSIAWISFPSIISLMLFRYTSTYYSLAILMSVLAAYIVIIANKKNFIFAIILSAILSACSLGIYQAYLPLTASILVLYLIQQSLDKNESWKQNLGKAIYYFISLILGLLFYFVFLKISLKYYDITLSDYQGIDNMGNTPLKEFFSLFYKDFINFCTMPIKNNYKLSPSPLVCKSYIILAVVSILIIMFIFFKKKLGILKTVLCILFCVAFPFAVDLIVVMCPESWIYTLMVSSFVIILFVPIVLIQNITDCSGWEIKLKKMLSVVISASICIIAIQYVYVANTTYTAEYYSNRQVENLTNSILTQVHTTEGFKKEQKWCFIGKADDNLIQFSWKDAPTVEGFGDPKNLFNSYSKESWFLRYTGYKINEVDKNRQNQLKNNEEVKSMPTWPDNGSVKIVEDTVIIKLSN